MRTCIINTTTILAAGMTGALLNACGAIDTGTARAPQDTHYTYEFTEADCTTGRRTFYNHNDYCKALLEEASNSYCASQLRLDTWQKNCSNL